MMDELEMVTKLQDAEILPLDINKAKVDYMVKAVCGFLQKGKVICEGEVITKNIPSRTINVFIKTVRDWLWKLEGKKIQIIIKEI